MQISWQRRRPQTSFLIRVVARRPKTKTMLPLLASRTQRAVVVLATVRAILATTVVRQPHDSSHTMQCGTHTHTHSLARTLGHTPCRTQPSASIFSSYCCYLLRRRCLHPRQLPLLCRGRCRCRCSWHMFYFYMQRAGRAVNYFCCLVPVYDSSSSTATQAAGSAACHYPCAWPRQCRR